jgi:hypothetical protein
VLPRLGRLQAGSTRRLSIGRSVPLRHAVRQRKSRHKWPGFRRFEPIHRGLGPPCLKLLKGPTSQAHAA